MSAAFGKQLHEPVGAGDARTMALALTLGRRGLGRTWPNPAVGAVIVKDGLIVGRGWTQPGGRPHAEIEALRRAGAAARGATLYVTLEPCSHYGKSPPCADAVIAAGIARVVSALEDPNPEVAGAGHARLRAAGITVGLSALAQRRRAAIMPGTFAACATAGPISCSSSQSPPTARPGRPDASRSPSPAKGRAIACIFFARRAMRSWWGSAPRSPTTRC